MDMQPIGQVLEQLAARIPTRTPMNSSAPTSPPNCHALWSRLSPEARARLTCPKCLGSGRIGQDRTQAACPICRGSGLRCPTCCGAHFLRRPGTNCQGMPSIDSLILRCPDCPTPEALHATIAAYVVAQLQAVAHG